MQPGATVQFTIKAVAQMIGMMVACFPGVEYGPLFYRQIDREKNGCIES